MRGKGERNGKYKEEIKRVRKSVISEKENKNGKRKMKEKKRNYLFEKCRKKYLVYKQFVFFNLIRLEF